MATLSPIVTPDSNRALLHEMRHAQAEARLAYDNHEPDMRALTIQADLLHRIADAAGLTVHEVQEVCS